MKNFYLSLFSFFLFVCMYAQPANDTFSGAIAIQPASSGDASPQFVLPFSTDGTTASNRPSSCNNPGNDQYFSWTADAQGLRFSSLSPGDPGIVVYDAAGSEITCTDTFSDSVELYGWNIGDNVVIRIFDLTSGNSDVAFDLEKVSCLAPEDFAIGQISATTADFTWTDVAGSGNASIEVGSVGFTAGQGNTTAVSSGAGTVSGLSPNTTYDAYVYQNCSSTSAPIGPISFTTLCVSYTNLPFYESVETTSADLACWEMIDNDNNDNGFLILSDPTRARSGSRSFMLESAISVATVDDYLVMPQIRLTGNERLRYYHKVSSSGSPVEYEILISSTGKQPADFTSVVEPLTTYTNEMYQERLIDLTGYTGDVFIAFHAPNGTVNNNAEEAYFDDLYVEDIPSCLAPSNFAVTNVDADQADFTWNNNSGSTQVKIEIGPAGFTTGNGAISTASGTSVTIQNLSEDTAYEAYISQTCSSTDSRWVGPISFRTPCTAKIAPYTTDFENFSTTSAFSTQNCWDDNSTSSFTWAVASNQTPSFSTGPDAAYSGSGFMYTETSGGIANDQAILYSPIIDTSSLTSPVLSFYYYMYGNGVTSLEVAISDDHGTTFNVLGTIDGQQQTAGDEAWKYAYYDLSSYANQQVIVRLSQTKGTTSNASSGDIAIDDFSLEEIAPCPNPSQITVQAVTADSATIDLNANSTNAVIEVEYGPAGFTQGTGTVLTANTSPFDISNLAFATEYEFIVRSSCTNGQFSDYSPRNSFTTICGARTVGYAEGFDQYEPLCWQKAFGRNDSTNISLTYGAHLWAEGPFSNDTTAGSNSVMADFQSCNRGEWIISPSIDLTGNEQIEFDVSMTDSGSNGSAQTIGNDDEFAVMISFDDGATWNRTDALKIYDNVGSPDVLSDMSVAGDRVIIDLSQHSNMTCRIGFYAATSSGSAPNRLFIDNFVVATSDFCAQPSNFAFANATTTSIDVSYQDNAGSGELAVEYGPRGFERGNGTSISVTTNPFTINGLMPSTDYDMYVQSVCGNSRSLITATPSFASACGTVAGPAIQSFETDDNLTCWIQSGDTSWEYGSQTGTQIPGFAENDAADRFDHSGSGTGTFIGMDGSDNTNGLISTLTSPAVDVSSISIPEISFWVYSHNSIDNAYNKLDVEVYDGSTWNYAMTIQGDLGDRWVNYDVDLASMNVTGPVQIRFTVTGDSTGGSTDNNDILIDDIAFQNAPFRYRDSWNRSPEGISTSNDDVFVHSGNAQLIGSMDARHLFVDDGATLEASSGDVTVTGSITNDGEITGVSTIRMLGSAPQQLLSEAGGAVENLIIDNTSGVTLEGNLIITGMLSVQSGDFDTNDNLTMRSDDSHTAMVGELGAGASISGKVTTQRYISAKPAYRFLTASVNSTESIFQNWQNAGSNEAGFGTQITGSGGSVNGFDDSGTNNPSMFRWDNINQQWNTMTSTNNGQLQAGVPYRIYVRGDRTYDLNVRPENQTSQSTVLEANGTLITGDVTSPNLGNFFGDFGMVGNPYMSPVDFESVLAIGSTNVRSDVYFVWDPTIGQNGAYVTHDFASSSNSVMGSAVDGTLRSGQAVFVEVDRNGGSNVRFRESDKIIDNVSQAVFSDQESPVMQVGLFENNQDKVAVDGVLIYMDNDSNKSAGKLMNPGANLFVKTEEGARSISALDEHRTMLSVQHDKTGEHVLRLKVPEAYLGLYEISDTVSGESLLLDQATNVFIYQATKAGQVKNRFIIQKASQESRVDNSGQIRMYPNPVTDGKFFVTNLSKNDQITITDLSGRLIRFDVRYRGAGNAHVSIDKTVANGVYIVQVTRKGKVIENEKLILK